MARLPDRSSRFMLITTFIFCLSILFVDFRFNAFKPFQSFYNSTSIFIRVFSSEYIVRPIYSSLSSIRDTRRTKEENQGLKEELNKQLIENYIISNKEILNRNKKLIKEGDVHTHPVWRSDECAISSTRRIVRIAERYNKKAHVLHITTKHVKRNI